MLGARFSIFRHMTPCSPVKDNKRKRIKFNTSNGTLAHADYCHIAGPDVLTAVIMNAAIFWDITPCSPYMNRRFGGTFNLYLQGRKSVGKESSAKKIAGLISTLKIEVIRSSETSLHIRITLRYIPEDSNIHTLFY
jgi:hypothetical protein